MPQACDSQSLVTAAQCLEQQIPPGMELPCLIILAANIAGVSTDPNSLAAAAAPYQAIPEGERWPVLISMACSIAGV